MNCQAEWRRVEAKTKACPFDIKKYYMLYVVPTPVGNMEDMTFRAIRVLKEADLILAEDTRTSSVLLQHYDIHGELLSHHKFNEHETVQQVVRRLQGGINAALISDAGTPGISDPGFLLVRECVKAGIEVQTLPGATAFVPALVSSGLPCDKFCFEGFLPQKKGRQSRLEFLKHEPRTIIIYESPYRLLKTLQQFAEVFGEERQVSVAREISKLHEQSVRGSLRDVIAHFTATEPRGEIVIILAGAGDDDDRVEDDARDSKVKQKHGNDNDNSICNPMDLIMGTGKKKNKYK